MSEKIIYRIPLLVWVMVAAMLGLGWVIFGDGVVVMTKNWNRDEYSHGYLIPFISMFLIWQQKDKLERIPFTNSWTGVGLVLLGLLLYIVGELSSVVDIIQYGFVVTVFGVILSYTGIYAYKQITVPLVLLLFMIPLPDFLYSTLSTKLQLISSAIGVEVIRLFDISVYLEGNVIDLGNYKLQVVEACSGLRYLFPLMTLGVIAAYLFKVEMWKRIFVFVSTIPITVLLNSFRVGAIGITVEYWGSEMAEGFLHDFEGWAVFMVCIAFLTLEMAVLAKIGKDRRPLVEVFGLEMPGPAPSDWPISKRSMPLSFMAVTGLLVFAALSVNLMPDRSELIPDRKDFSVFPREFGGWTGQVSKMESIYVDALNFDDYLLADYQQNGLHHTVNLYIGYYATQRADKVPHSPKSCLPGGGWAIIDLTTRVLPGQNIGGVPLQVNRVVISKGKHKQLVYYWFQQRDRVISNEWLVKWYLLIDAIRESRTDGALVRLVTLVDSNEDLSDGDQRLREFASYVAPILPEYVPD